MVYGFDFANESTETLAINYFIKIFDNIKIYLEKVI